MNTLDDQYDQLLQSHPQQVQDAILSLESEMDRRNCKFGEDIVPVFLRPLFMQKSEAKHVSQVLKHIMSILEKVTQLYFSRPELQDYFYLDERGKDLIAMDHGYKRNIMVSRPDSFLVNSELRFVEFNCDSPAGAGLADVEEEIFKTVFPFPELKETFKFAKHKRREYLLKGLLAAYAEFAGKHKKPNIAIIDWREVRTQNEFQLIREHFRSRGYDTIITDPRDLKFRQGKLYCKDFRIDLIYRRVIFKELLAKLDEVQDFITAFRKGKVCVVNPFRSRLASSKAILAIITNPKEYRQFFTKEENHVINRHIPWTRRVVDIRTHYGDNRVFLLRHIINHQAHLVLKPADSYGGKDVVIGCECDAPDWEILLNKILKDNADWVVQRYVNIPRMTVPVKDKGAVKFQSKKFNVNPFVFGGKYAGSIARLSDQSVINVSAGGGLVPVVEYTEK